MTARRTVRETALTVAIMVLGVFGFVTSLCLVAMPTKPAKPNPPTRAVLVDSAPAAPLFITSTVAPTRLLEVTQRYNLMITTDRGDVVFNCATGQVRYPPGVDLDEATRLFWAAMARTRP